MVHLVPGPQTCHHSTAKVPQVWLADAACQCCHQLVSCSHSLHAPQASQTCTPPASLPALNMLMCRDKLLELLFELTGLQHEHCAPCTLSIMCP